MEGQERLAFQIPKLQSKDRVYKQKYQSTVIHTHNKMIDGVDRGDQIITSYPNERKRVKKQYNKHFMHFIKSFFIQCTHRS